jgi:hypothetical protein
LPLNFGNLKPITMNVITATKAGLSSIIDQLQKQKDELTTIYHAAITNGEKLHEVKTIYITLKDVDKKLNDLMRVCY